MNLTGQRVGQYRITEPIGQGGMAFVYKAYQAALERFVAIKVLPIRHAISNGFVERFEHEARTVAQLNHANILPILDFGREQDFSYIVTKLVTGGTLKDRLARPFTLDDAARIIEQIAAALDHAHGRGVLHRDVKPSNVLLDEGDWVQLADFGLAKMLGGDTGLTVSGVGIGTPAYMSPEQGQGMTIDHRADIYSLGVVLYEMVTGRLPYDAETPIGIIFKHIYEPLTLPRLVRSDIPPLIEVVILKALEKKPEDRYASAGELAEALWEAVRASEAGGETALKPLTVAVDDVSTQPTLTLDEHGAVVAKPSEAEEPSRRTVLPEITPPPESPRPPDVETFVGRETELSYFADKLETLRLAVITGMPGVGKTTFAARLIQEKVGSGPVFWHSFHESEGVEAVIWKLAGFLYWHGQQELWQMLQGTQQNGGQPPPIEVLLDYLIQMARGQNYTLCLDDLHLVEDDPLLAQLIDRLYRTVASAELSLILVSRQVPQCVPMGEFEPLIGLSVEDIHGLLAAHGLSLPEDLVDELYTQTEGNAQMLTLAIETLKRTPNPRRIVAHLVEADDIERYLMAEVDAGLTREEREVMGAVAVLLGYPASRDAIEAVLDGDSVRRVLGDLSRRHLLTVSSREWDKEYLQHVTVRAFYYDLLGRRERREMHRCAGGFYHTVDPDRFKAALHFERAEEFEQSALLATEDVWAFINQGQARALSRLLQRFQARHLDAALWTDVNIALGQVLSFLRDSRHARDCYQEALSELEALPDTSEMQEARARACRGMGELLEYEAPREALEWLQRGLNELKDASDAEEAALHLRIGSTQIALGDYAAAITALERGLELVPEDQTQLRVRGLADLGTAYGTQGDIERGNGFSLEALEISQQMNDFYQMLVIQSNLGIDKQIQGDWDAAVVDYRQALAIAEQLGSVAEQVRIESNLGLLYTNRGDNELARARLSNALELARRHQLNEQLVAILSNLADLNLRVGQADTAKPLLAEAERLALEMDSRFQLPEIYRGWAQAQLLEGQPDGAMVNAERSVSLARELGLSLEEGVGLRVLGQTLVASDQVTPGVGAFQQSLVLLVDDPYEVARGKTEWGRYLVSDTDTEYGQSLLREARAAFQALAAKRDLEIVDALLAASG